MARVSPPWMVPQPNPEYTDAILAATHGTTQGGRTVDLKKFARATYGRSDRLRQYKDTEMMNKSIPDYPNQVWPRGRPRTRPGPPSPPPPATYDLSQRFTKAPELTLPAPPQPVQERKYSNQEYYDRSQPSLPTKFGRQATITRQFYSHGTGIAVSDNGKADANLYYKTNRPLGGRARSHYVTNITPAGYNFEMYTGKP